MEIYIWLLSCSLLVLVISVLGHDEHNTDDEHDHKDKHGGVPMGKVTHQCDDGKWNIEIDWDDSSDYQYKCQPGERTLRAHKKVSATEECLEKEDIPDPLHKCMSEAIVYDDTPPVGGPHRPLWPAYGEYLYVPAQRWVHPLEHGAAVFLYHPCAEEEQINQLRELAKSCLRRYILTPYRELNDNLFAVVTYGCRLQMNGIDSDTIMKFIMNHAIGGKNKDEGPEWTVTRDGLYTNHLLKGSDIVSDIADSRLCPHYQDKLLKEKNSIENLLIAETMID